MQIKFCGAIIIALLLLSKLSVSQSDHYYNIPSGSTITLNKEILIPANEWRVYIGVVSAFRNFQGNSIKYSISVVFIPKKEQIESDNSVSYPVWTKSIANTDRIVKSGRVFKIDYAKKPFLWQEYCEFFLYCDDGSQFKFIFSTVSSSNSSEYQRDLLTINDFIDALHPIISIKINSSAPKEY